MSTPPLDVSVVLVSWNTRDLVTSCLASLPAALGALRSDVWLVDNASSDDTVAAVRAQYPAVNVIVNEGNLGYAAAANRAVNVSTGRYVLLLNSDTLAHPSSFQRLVEFADATPHAWIASPKMLNPDGSFQGSFSDFPTLWSEFLATTGIGKRVVFRDYPGHGPHRAKVPCRADCVGGPVMLVRRETFARIGLMDEGYFMYSEETDLCWRIVRAGGECWFTPDAEVVHLGGQSTRRVRFAMQKALFRSKVLFFRKHYGARRAAVLQAMLVSLLRLKWVAMRLAALRDPSIPRDPPIQWRDLSSQ